MIEVFGNLWTYPADVRIITTNGMVNSKGECVMGRGCAAEAKHRYPNLPKELAVKLKATGNHPYAFDEYDIITFPVKHKWFEWADLPLIKTSALQLAKMLDPNKIYVLPRPGCGNGKRSWNEVRGLLTKLPDNVHVITYPLKTDAYADQAR